MERQQHASPLDEDELMKSQMEKMVGSYDSYMRNITLGRERALRERTLDLAGVRPGDCVLEVGCGTGTLTLAAKKRAGSSGEVFGIDIIPGMIEAARRKAAQAGEAIAFQSGSIADIPFPDDRFDVVLCSFMIFHMAEVTRLRGIAEIHRVLRPEGRLFVVDLALPAGRVQRAIAKRLFATMLQHDPQELRPALSANGFAGIESGHVPFRVLGLSVLGYLRGQANKR